MKYIDVSTWQGAVDWAKVKAAGVDGVLIRAGFGTSTIDNKFIRNISECNRLGIPCGVYWFSYATDVETAKQEARACLSAVAPYRVELPVCFDFEYDSIRYAKEQGVTITKELATSFVHAFCSVIEEAGYYAMNYANPDFLRNYFDESVLRYDLWFAAYPGGTPDLTKKPREEVGIWQYTSTGTVDGIGGNVDMNVAFRDYRAVIAAAGLNRLKPAEPSTPAPVIADPELFSQLMTDWMAEQGKREPDAWSEEARKWAEANGLVQGTGDGMAYQRPMTREEVITLMYRFGQQMVDRRELTKV